MWLWRSEEEGNTAGDGAVFARARVVQERGVDAVSYTHLRAHETVLDLVCRLLLEQKNNHKNLSILLVHSYTQKITVSVIVNYHTDTPP